jgi:hypothetical protein
VREPISGAPFAVPVTHLRGPTAGIAVSRERLCSDHRLLARNLSP